MKKTLVDFVRILDHVRYRDWEFHAIEQSNGEVFLQLSWVGPDTDTDEYAELKSRKWKLSAWMTKSEVVQTAFKAVMTAEEHETREAFKYRNVAIFGPHFDVDEMAAHIIKKDTRHEQR